ncbi:MAG: hypothetical protein CL715_03985 [Chloroflexi bacterium]|nr:hypothetical protein [Chloroflexota bacterium]|tara:strand:+ start:16043 stop:16390 length:348 start_codon:yes stop_codon:yes gene_type:complete
MQKIFLKENKELRIRIFLIVFTILIFVPTIFVSDKYIEAEEPSKLEKNSLITEEVMMYQLEEAVLMGKLTEEQAILKWKLSQAISEGLITKEQAILKWKLSQTISEVLITKENKK